MVIDPDIDNFVKRRLTLETLYRLDADLERDGWDQPHRLYFVLKAGEASPWGENALAWGLSLHEVPISNIGFDRLSPVEWLPALANVVKVDADQPFFGWLLAAEAWSTRAHAEREPERVAYLESLAGQRKLHTLPEDERIEIRLLILATADGHQVSLMHERDGVVHELSTYPTADGLGDDPMPGQLAEGLTLLTQRCRENETCRHCGDGTDEDDPSPTLCIMCAKAGRD